MAEDAVVEAEAKEEPKLISDEPLLAIMGKRFPLDLMGGELTVHGVPVFVQEKPNTGEGTAHTVWDGGVVLAKYLEHKYTAGLVDKTVLELGSGTGIVGVVASILGARRVYLTDLPYALPTLQDTIERNALSCKGHVAAVPLDWTAPDDRFDDVDIIVASDVVWVQELILPLVGVLEHLTAHRPDPPLVILSHQTRSTASDELFFGALRRNFEVTTVPADEHHPEFRDADAIGIYELRRRRGGSGSGSAGAGASGAGGAAGSDLEEDAAGVCGACRRAWRLRACGSVGSGRDGAANAPAHLARRRS
eukprot:CAMPEP_0203814672 /NCGR_PEP_ID=MMETSP0115-20131106/5420_1 /ASSEMBLY_ACC=CAM_ASM_000227 /TAXON_ID=33651 /ORGANISM="Bicosoecid sp, Strain ms1" /LENGTH=305 /DNA_ID=CAMNT_0050723553 /DNA_START=98 /DNA_END=1012 /DNA_ORIENTATION=-